MDDSSRMSRVNPNENMVMDGFGAAKFESMIGNRNDVEDNPPPAFSEFFDMLNAAWEPLYPSCKLSQLEAASKLLNIKYECNIPHRATYAIAALLKNICPEDNVMTNTLYSTNRLMRGI